MKKHPSFLKGLFCLLVTVSLSVSAVSVASASSAVPDLSVVSASSAATTRPAGDHPYYLHALSDLRAARWMIEHRPGNWQQTVDEIEAVHRIDAAIAEIKKAAIEDGKNLEDHPPVDESNDHDGRLHAALDFLRKARKDISHDEDNGFAQGLQGRAYGHIDGAINAVKKAIHA